MLIAGLASGLAGCQSGGVFRTWPDRAPPDAARYGEYLAAHVAGLNRNVEAAAAYWARVWKRDRQDPAVLERAVQAYILAGDLEQATGLARRAAQTVLAGSPSARILLLTAGFGREPMSTLHSLVEDDPEVLGRFYQTAAQDMIDWAAIGRGLSPDWQDEKPVIGGPWLYNRAFMYQAMGNEASARLLFEQAWQSGDRLPLAARTYVGLLAGAGRRDKALQLAQSFETQLRHAPLARRFARALERGETPQTEPLTPRQGAALALFLPTLVPIALTGASGRHSAIILLRLALSLDPKSGLARLRLAEYLMLSQMPEAALAELDRIEPGSPWYVSACLQRSYMLLELKRKDEALVTARSVQALIDGRFERVELGRLFIGLRQYGRAEALFSQVIKTDLRADREDWQAFFARGQARERQGKWALAKVDLQKALHQVPNRPEILNYLGYSWLDRGENVEKAFALIRRAAVARPDSGAIIDSLGWAYFRLGRYQQAVVQLEEASVLDPADPVVADHLGDAYWRVGRTREARYQWQKALNMDPEPHLRTRLDAKLRSGLDASVLPPVAVP